MLFASNRCARNRCLLQATSCMVSSQGATPREKEGKERATWGGGMDVKDEKRRKRCERRIDLISYRHRNVSEIAAQPRRTSTK
ncbi:hypothetical protein BDW66DRAFT_129187 [Aspergillus desertorum]